MYDVIGIGNPLMDVLVKVDDKTISNLNLKNGSMHLIDEETSKNILKSFNEDSLLLVPGGDVVNTVTGIANLGGKSVFCGKVGDDEHGLLIEKIMTKDGVKTSLVKGTLKTGSAISLVTPDQERTFATHLGSAITLSKDEVIIKDIKNSKILYVTGYVLEDPNLRKMALKALNEAKKHNTLVAIDVSDPSLVERCKDDLKKILLEFADIVFANEEEVVSLTGKSKEEGLEEFSKLADIAVVKIGKEGALINNRGTVYKIKGFKVDAVDTTGAGDLFAAGFLFGLTNGYNIEKSGLIGNYIASKTVQQLGARLSYSLKKDIKKLFLEENL